jgi:hypothetical protein
MTKEQMAPYRAALKEARDAFDKASKRLSEITEESRCLNEEVNKLRRTITALAAMCAEEPHIDRLGITDTVADVMEAEKSTVTTSEVVKLVEGRGFDLVSQKNASASVHTVLLRLARKGKITRLESEDEKKTTIWRGPNYDSDYDMFKHF